MEERLHKILAHAGFGSRRACEELLATGRVTVNGQVAKVGDKAQLGEDDIRVDGSRVKAERQVYFLLNKPVGYICTNADPEGRRKVTDLLERVRERVYPVGRLDADSRGLLLLTNDGELAMKLTHPRFGVPKTYEAEIAGRISSEHVHKLMTGVRLSEGATGPCQVRVLRRGQTQSLIEFTLHEGMNRQVRRMLAKFGYKVRSLTRVRLGPLDLRGLGSGKYRELTPDEVKALYKGAEGGQKRIAARKAAKPRASAEEATKKVAAAAAKPRKPEVQPKKKAVEPRPDKELAKRRRIYDFTE